MTSLILLAIGLALGLGFGAGVLIIWLLARALRQLYRDEC